MLFYLLCYYLCCSQNKDANSQVSDSHLEKYEEIVKCKDEHIKDLESKVMELQKNVDNEDNSG